ncbi:hypothetical protein H0264_13060 [Nocardia huaxiensis]|uniref:Uncharacterized protein n=1 Tax=Nocardia huaxiensis TaxID=2755382 RepID=A0A7D6VHP4_9NOCA|nr:hypothetical protein [Nocardia huaxiensis]QLY33035.1 hypothetical protein H0264_13060 [Nocardia huaxiensis]
MSATVTLTAHDNSTLRTAAYGAVSLMSAAGAPHKGVSRASIALTSATGLCGHVLAAKSRDIQLSGKNTAELAEQVLPALSAAVALLRAQDPAEADNFQTIVTIAVESAAYAKGQPTPAVAAMAHKISAALGTV